MKDWKSEITASLDSYYPTIYQSKTEIISFKKILFPVINFLVINYEDSFEYIDHKITKPYINIIITFKNFELDCDINGILVNSDDVYFNHYTYAEFYAKMIHLNSMRFHDLI